MTISERFWLWFAVCCSIHHPTGQAKVEYIKLNTPNPKGNFINGNISYSFLSCNGNDFVVWCSLNSVQLNIFSCKCDALRTKHGEYLVTIWREWHEYSLGFQALKSRGSHLHSRWYLVSYRWHFSKKKFSLLNPMKCPLKRRNNIFLHTIFFSYIFFHNFFSYDFDNESNFDDESKIFGPVM